MVSSTSEVSMIESGVIVWTLREIMTWFFRIWTYNMLQLKCLTLHEKFWNKLMDKNLKKPIFLSISILMSYVVGVTNRTKNGYLDHPVSLPLWLLTLSDIKVFKLALGIVTEPDWIKCKIIHYIRRFAKKIF